MLAKKMQDNSRETSLGLSSRGAVFGLSFCIRLLKFLKVLILFADSLGMQLKTEEKH